MAKKRSTLTIKGIGVLDARCDTYLGKVIDYVKQTPLHQNNKGIAIEMLFARFQGHFILNFINDFTSFQIMIVKLPYS